MDSVFDLYMVSEKSGNAEITRNIHIVLENGKTRVIYF